MDGWNVKMGRDGAWVIEMSQEKKAERSMNQDVPSDTTNPPSPISFNMVSNLPSKLSYTIEPVKKLTKKELQAAHQLKMAQKKKARQSLVLPVYASRLPRIGDKSKKPRTVHQTGTPEDNAVTQIAGAAPINEAVQNKTKQARMREELDTILLAKPEFAPSYKLIHSLILISETIPTEGAERRVFLSYDATPLEAPRRIGQALFDVGGTNLMHFALLCLDPRDHGELAACWDGIGTWKA